MSNNANSYFRYLPVSQRDKQWGIYVTAGGVETIKPGEVCPQPGHPIGYTYSWNNGRCLHEYQILFVFNGAGEFESNPSGNKKLVAGSTFILFPGVWHRYRPYLNIGWKQYWVSFNGPNMDRLVKHSFFSPQNPVLKTGVNDQLLHAYLTLLDRLRSEPVGFSQFLAASVTEILAAVIGAVRAQGTGNHMQSLVSQAKTLLETQLDTVPTMEKLAASLGLSMTHFYRVFREHTGLTPYQYHQELRIERAKQMLHGTAMNVREIAASLAFESPFHFSHVFKRKTGVSPSLWRKRFVADASGGNH
ncbi:MAG: helix-turn-helix transcriptional regulator [Sedimentisphaerales bacterium]|nr:helix-turn-helix transcriptional regulator [Sedimentisphaerales bacterium]